MSFLSCGCFEHLDDAECPKTVERQSAERSYKEGVIAGLRAVTQMIEVIADRNDRDGRLFRLDKAINARVAELEKES